MEGQIQDESRRTFLDRIPSLHFIWDREEQQVMASITWSRFMSAPSSGPTLHLCTGKFWHTSFRPSNCSWILLPCFSTWYLTRLSTCDWDSPCQRYGPAQEWECTSLCRKHATFDRLGHSKLKRTSRKTGGGFCTASLGTSDVSRNKAALKAHPFDRGHASHTSLRSSHTEVPSSKPSSCTADWDTSPLVGSSPD